MGSRTARSSPRSRNDWFIEDYEETDPRPAPQPYLPSGGRNFVPQQGTFNCTPSAFTVIPASFLPERTTDPNAAIDAALTAAGLSAADRSSIHRAGLRPIASEFGSAALTELIARLRWSAAYIVAWGTKSDSMLVQRLLLHVPGHFRELARRAPDAREAFVLECTGWLLMTQLRNLVANATQQTWWLPPAPSFVTVVPDPVPPVSAAVRQLLLRHGLIDTTMTADQWNARLVEWGSGLAGRQWQAEVSAPQAGRPFYATLVSVPAHINSATLQLHLSQSISGDQTFELRRVTAGWGEGTSDAPGAEGTGTTATTNSATWLHRFFPATFWATAGGDFAPTASATALVGINFVNYFWSSSQLASDVQSWLDAPSTQFGWVLKEVDESLEGVVEIEGSDEQLMHIREL
jgi:hypothetical protein